MNHVHTSSRSGCKISAVLLAAAFFGNASANAADALQSKSTYSKSYGATKGTVEVDAAKDLPRYPAVESKDADNQTKTKP